MFETLKLIDVCHIVIMYWMTNFCDLGFYVFLVDDPLTFELSMVWEWWNSVLHVNNVKIKDWVVFSCKDAFEIYGLIMGTINELMFYIEWCQFKINDWRVLNLKLVSFLYCFCSFVDDAFIYINKIFYCHIPSMSLS